MKRFVLILLVVVGAVAALAPLAQAQMNNATTTANAGVTMITAIGIARTSHLNFGSVVAGALLGTVVQTAAASPVRSATGGTTLGSASAVTPATFNVTGQANNTYAITLPSSAITISDGPDNMGVDTFTSSPSGTGTLDGSGAQTLYVGATLHVGASQASGVYSGSFSVTVTYN
ncbi:MAG TPA: DUF4402 domain-containing protein [Candidatus Saccharimonadales bacterium]|nr:DUF4402 domain-containing protein [Candidatus Saccharimonadales bacterium]